MTKKEFETADEPLCMVRSRHINPNYLTQMFNRLCTIYSVSHTTV